MEDEQQQLDAFLTEKRKDARREGEKCANGLTVYRRETFGLLEALTKYLKLLCSIDPHDPPEDEDFWTEMRRALNEIAGYGGTACLREELNDVEGRAQKVRAALEWTDERRVSKTGPHTYTLSRGDES